MTDQTIFERCFHAAYGEMQCRDPSAHDVTRAVIQTIIDNTGSPYTVDELTRILGEA